MELVVGFFGGTALPAASKRLHDLLQSDYLPCGRRWPLDPRLFLESDAQWAGFIRLVAGLADWEEVCSFVRRAGNDRLSSACESAAFSTLPYDKLLAECMLVFHRSVAIKLASAGDLLALIRLRARLANKEIAAGWSDVVDSVAMAAATNDRPDILTYIKRPPSTEEIRAAALAGSVGVCALIHTTYGRSIDWYDNLMTNLMTPETLVKYEEAIGSPVPSTVCNAFCAIRKSNLDLVIWLVGNGRSTWRYVMGELLSRACESGDTSLSEIKRAVAAGCPFAPEDYPTFFCRSPDKAAEVISEFILLSGQRPGDYFVEKCLINGSTDILAVLMDIGGVVLSNQVLGRFLLHLNVKTLEWMARRGLMFKKQVVVDRAFPRLLASDNARVFGWLYSRAYFSGCPDIAESAVAASAFNIVDVLSRSPGYSPPSWEGVASKFRINLAADDFVYYAEDRFIDWLFANGSSGDDDAVGIARCMALFKGIRGNIKASVSPVGSLRIKAYCDSLERDIDAGRINLAGLRATCKSLGVTPKSVRGKPLSSYVDCIRRRFSLA